MAAKTSGEFEKEFLDGLQASTGKDLKTWLGILDGFGGKKRPEVVKWLKETHGFGHMHASLLAGIHANGGKLVYDSIDNLLENQFAKAGDMRPLYDALIEFVNVNFPEATVLPKKTYVSILENREFGAVNIKPMELRMGFDLGDRPFDDAVSKSKLSGPMPRISHMIVITSKDQFGEGLVKLLTESRGRCH
jgi:hypothetical protein